MSSHFCACGRKKIINWLVTMGYSQYYIQRAFRVHANFGEHKFSTCACGKSIRNIIIRMQEKEDCMTIEPMSNEQCRILINGYSNKHMPSDILQLCASYFLIWHDLKLVYCDAKTG